MERGSERERQIEAEKGKRSRKQGNKRYGTRPTGERQKDSYSWMNVVHSEAEWLPDDVYGARGGLL